MNVSTNKSEQDFHWKNLTVVILFLLAVLSLFLNLAEDILEKEVFTFDWPTLRFLHDHATEKLNLFMIFFTKAASVQILLPFDIMVFAALLFYKRNHDAIFWVISIAGAAGLNMIAKEIVGRSRPDLWVSLLPEVSYSFPSGHSMNSMATILTLIAILWLHAYRNMIAASGIFFVLLIGISRMYLGVHYPSDVIGGWAASICWVGTLTLLYRHLRSGLA